MSPQQPEMRIGDSDREAAVTALGDHYAAGRLTKEEYDERAGRAFAAKTASELWPLFADLPRPQAARATSGPAQAPRVPAGSRPVWWGGAWMAPLLLVVVALVVLTHLPLFLLLVVGWVFLARMGRRRACGRGQSHSGTWQHRGWVR